MADEGDENANWRFGATEEIQLATLARVAWVEQQQREPLAPLLDLSKENEVEADAATNVLDVLAETSHGELLKRFLDRLAEVFAREKEPINFVSCTAMVEQEDNATIFISRNKKFDKDDFKFSTNLASCLELLSRGKFYVGKNRLWELLLAFYERRIEYNVRRFLDAMRSSTQQRSLSVVNERDTAGGFSKLRSDCQQFRADNKYLAGSIIENAYHLARAVDIRACLGRSIKQGQIQSTLELLRFLGRLRIAYATILNAAKRFPSFSKVRFIFVETPVVSNPRPSLEQAIGVIDACFKTGGLIMPSWMTEPVPHSKFKKFEVALGQPLHVHAELQMMFFLLHPDRGDLQPLPYLGASKKTCLLCGHVLANFPRFGAQGNHGKIYPNWTLPRQARLQKGYLTGMNVAAQSLMKIVASLVLDRDRSRLDMVKESVAAPSTSSGVTPTTDRAVDHLRCHAPPTEILSDLELEQSAQESACPAPNPVVCDGCGDDKYLRRCSKCKKGWYCGKQCQEADWYQHKFHCRIGRELDSADYLVLDCIRDEMPQEPSVLEDFGFRHFDDVASHSHILGLFEGLVKYLKVGDRKIHRWQVEGTLKQNIIAAFSTLPANLRGGYFAWFLKHDWIFSPPEERSSSDMIDALKQSAISFLDVEDRDIPPEALQPQAKQHAFLIYTQLLNGWHPRPGTLAWISLGFCTRREEWAEAPLGVMYQQLIEKCSFQEFWKAMDTPSMLCLLDKYGFTKTYKTFRHFEPLMNGVNWNISVWALKEFCNMADPDPSRTVIADYGFMNCHNAKDRQDLKKAYQTFFQRWGDELELHDACCKGQIFECVQSTQPLEPRFRRLMRNPYPLSNP